MKTSDNESAYELAGEYVLGTLPEAERRAVIERLKTDPELASWLPIGKKSWCRYAM